MRGLWWFWTLSAVLLWELSSPWCDGSANGAGLDDSFSGDELDPKWSVLNPERANVTVREGQLQMVVVQGGAANIWFNQNQGVLVYRNVTGDFDVSTVAHARRATDTSLPPSVEFRLVGLLVRDPASSPLNSVHIAVGAGTSATGQGPISVENKSTTNGDSAWDIQTIPDPDLELRLARVASNVSLFYRAVGASDWVYLWSYDRPDLPSLVQVGLMAYDFNNPPNLYAAFDGIEFAVPNEDEDGTDCSNLTAPVNGDVSDDAVDVGDSVEFSCQPGYTLTGGNASLVCTANGNLSGPVPTCVAVACPSISAPANGSVSGTAGVHGDTVVFSCVTGFSLVGADNATCSNGSWSHSVPTCTEDNIVPAQCPVLNPPVHGSASATQGSHGDTVSFACSVGYALQGHANITCLQGNWSADVPTCQSTACPTITAPNDGTSSATGGNEGDVVTFDCEPDRVLVGVPNITCVNNTWSGSVPACDDPCEPNPCREAGDTSASCSLAAGNVACSCSGGYSGSNCTLQSVGATVSNSTSTLLEVESTVGNGVELAVAPGVFPEGTTVQLSTRKERSADSDSDTKIEGSDATKNFKLSDEVFFEVTATAPLVNGTFLSFEIDCVRDSKDSTQCDATQELLLYDNSTNAYVSAASTCSGSLYHSEIHAADRVLHVHVCHLTEFAVGIAEASAGQVEDSARDTEVGAIVGGVMAGVVFWIVVVVCMARKQKQEREREDLAMNALQPARGHAPAQGPKQPSQEMGSHLVTPQEGGEEGEGRRGWTEDLQTSTM